MFTLMMRFFVERFYKKAAGVVQFFINWFSHLHLSSLMSTALLPRSSQSRYGGFLKWGYPQWPSHHPFIDRNFHEINHPFLGIPPWLWFYKWWYPKMDGLQKKIPLKRMIWGDPDLWKPPSYLLDEGSDSGCSLPASPSRLAAAAEVRGRSARRDLPPIQPDAPWTSHEPRNGDRLEMGGSMAMGVPPNGWLMSWKILKKWMI